MVEPRATDWRVVPLGAFADLVWRQVGAPPGRPPAPAVDGRSSGGKTTLAGRLAAVHTLMLAGDVELTHEGRLAVGISMLIGLASERNSNAA
jgi:hypothetical protein